MSSLNIKIKEKLSATNHNGVAVKTIPAENQLVRSVLANMLWEGEFYENGQSNADRLKHLVSITNPTFVANLATRARDEFKLRHVPLLLARELARHGNLKAQTLTNIIQRPDEMSEFLSIYWKDGKTPLANQVKKGLSNAFSKFKEYQLAKWDKNSAAISLRDVMFLVHPNPNGREDLFKRIAEQTLETPDTWETALSAGADKKETFSRLMDENKLGALAFLRNLRNMVGAGIDESSIRQYAKNVNVEKVLPFRYIAAAKIVPQFEDMLEDMMLRSLQTHEKLPGKTVLLIDVSGSMWMGAVSEKSDLQRFDAAAALAMLCREICDEVAVYSFSERLVRVAPRRGFALRGQISNSQPHSGTRLGAAMQELNRYEDYDRIIIFTDEQTHDTVPNPKGKGYILNVASYKNGINSGTYETITGFSEAVIDFIQQSEKL